MKHLFLFESIIGISFDMSFQDGVVISQTHLPIMHDEIVNDVNFVLILMHVQRFDVGFHQNWAFLLGFFFDLLLIFVPDILVLLVSL